MPVTHKLSTAIGLKADRHSHVNRLSVCDDMMRLQRELRIHLAAGEEDIAILTAERIAQLATLQADEWSVGEMETAAETIAQLVDGLFVPKLNISLGLALRKEGRRTEAARYIIPVRNLLHPAVDRDPRINTEERFDRAVLAAAAKAKLELDPVQVMREMRSALNVAWSSETLHLKSFVTLQYETSCWQAGEAETAIAIRHLRETLNFGELPPGQWLYHPQLWA